MADRKYALINRPAVLSTDLTPQLGGDLDANGHRIDADGGIRVLDSGGTDYIDITHNGTHAVYDYVNTSDVRSYGASYWNFSPDDVTAAGASMGSNPGTPNHVLALATDTATDLIGFMAYLGDGSENARASFFIDGTDDEWGISHTWSSSGNFDFVIYQGNVEHFRWDFANTTVTAEDHWEFTDYVKTGTYLQTRTETQTNLRDITHAVNTDAGKVQGALVFDSTNNQPVWAAGAADGSVWVDSTGATRHTPA